MQVALYNHKLISVDQALKNKIYRCPFCKKPIKLCSKHKRSSYFIHVKSSQAYYNPGETKEHLHGKSQIYQFLKSHHPNLKLELFLSTIDQYPDLITHRQVIEFQCSPISYQRLKERVLGYRKLHIKSWWILGSHYYHTRINHNLLLKFMNYSRHLGFFLLFWSVKNNCLKIKYQIRDIDGQLTYRIIDLYDFIQLTRFLKGNRLYLYDLRKHNYRIVKSIQKSQHRVFSGEKVSLNFYLQIYSLGYSLFNAPMVVHFPRINFPILDGHFVEWHTLVLALLLKNSDLKIVYHKSLLNWKSRKPFINCRFKNYYQISFQIFIKYLVQFHFIKVDQHLKYECLKIPRWFNSFDDKLKYLKKAHD